MLIAGRCPVDTPDWTDGPPQQRHRVLLVRRGAFLRRLNGFESLVDSTTASVVRPGDEMQVAHPLGCGDLFTIVELDAEAVDELGLRHGDFSLGDDVDLAHRQLVTTAARGADELELGELMAEILRRLPAQSEIDVSGHHVAHRRLVNGATQLLVEDGFGHGLDSIAGQLNCSPHHLSRVFRRVTGQTMSSYRNRVRVRHVLADIQDGARCLRDLAVRYGFADQAHMIRVVRRHAGDSPGTLKKLLRT